MNLALVNVIFIVDPQLVQVIQRKILLPVGDTLFVIAERTHHIVFGTLGGTFDCLFILCFFFLVTILYHQSCLAKIGPNILVHTTFMYIHSM